MTRTRETLPHAGLRVLICVFGLGLFGPGYKAPVGLAAEAATHGTSREACPIDVKLSVAADTCAVGENFIITCTFTNITRDPVRLHAIDLDLLVDPLWIGIDDGPPKRGHRIALHSGKERPGTEDVIELGPAETVETKIFFLQGETLASFLSDAGVVYVRADVGPLIVYGDSKNMWTVTTNAIRIAVRASDRQELDAFSELDSILTGRAKRGMSTYLSGLEEWVTDHADSALAPRIHYELAVGWSGRLDALKIKELQAPHALFASLRFCLEKGAPYSNVVGLDYLEFLYAQKRWELVELAALRIQERTRISRLSDSAESYIGAWGALLDTSAFAEIDDTWKKRLRPPLLGCLRRSLESGNEHAMRQAPRLLARLERLEAWTVLGQVAEWAQVGCSSAVDVNPYIKAARERAGNGSQSNASSEP